MDQGQKTNGHSSAGSGSGAAQPTSDLYKQLINNDMVKELDDIEAISQQIFQHAEVLHNSWKNNGMSQGPQFKLGAAGRGAGPGPAQPGPVSPGGAGLGSPLSLAAAPQRSAERERGGQQQQQQQTNGSSLKQPSHYTRQAGYSDTPSADSGGHYNSWPGPGHRQLHLTADPASPRGSSSSVSSPTSSTRDSPGRGSSVTHLNPAEAGTGPQHPLELLASPNLNGNLEDLVSSFVTTDRAKQAARNTISSTLMRRLGSPNGSASPVRSPSPQPTSPTSALSYRGASPLRSPMLTSSAGAGPGRGEGGVFPSDGQDSVHSPMQSIFSKGPAAASLTNGPGHKAAPPPSYSHTLPKASPGPAHGDIHAPLQSLFHSAPRSPASSLNFNNGPASKTSPLHIQTEREASSSTDSAGGIPIPVKHIPIAKAPSSGSEAGAGGLKSPGVLQNAAAGHPLAAAAGPGDQHAPMPNLFNEFGSVSDARFLEMRRKFEEAKQRMALSLPAREGGVRPNSFGNMGKSLFDSPWGDDPSSFLLEQVNCCAKFSRIFHCNQT